jgi:hypothetical protein
MERAAEKYFTGRESTGTTPTLPARSAAVWNGDSTWEGILYARVLLHKICAYSSTEYLEEVLTKIH